MKNNPKYPDYRENRMVHWRHMKNPGYLEGIAKNELDFIQSEIDDLKEKVNSLLDVSDPEEIQKQYNRCSRHIESIKTIFDNFKDYLRGFSKFKKYS